MGIRTLWGAGHRGLVVVFFRSVARARNSVAAAAAATLVGAAVVAASPASAGPVIPGLPQQRAAGYTPRVVDDAVLANAGVREFHRIGSTMYAGGAINSVQNENRSVTSVRRNLVAFDPATGALRGFAPQLDGQVYALESTPDGRYLYVAGDFRNADGVRVKKLVRYDVRSGTLDPGFVFRITNNRISDLQLVGDKLFVAGVFPGAIVAVDPSTGAKLPYFDGVQATGQEDGWSTRIYRFAIDPARSRMVVIGAFQAIGGQPRQQAAMVNLGPSSATLSPWYSTRWDESCASSLQWYSRDVDWSPDGSRFVIVTTGAGFPGTPKLCDTASAWAPVDAPQQQPLWVQYSGGDTFHSATWTDKGVFVGGHFRWLDNPSGRDFKGPGAVDRKGIGALDPLTGKALAWNPGKGIEGGNGAFDLFPDEYGLWVGHFEKRLGTAPSGTFYELHEGLGLLPY